MASDSTSKAFLISSIFLAGSGVAYILYQQYVLARTRRNLTSQIVLLNQRILKLENDIKQIKEVVAASSSTDEIDEVFVDASDVAHQSIPEGSESKATIPEEHCIETVDDKLLANLDHEMEEGGHKNLTSAHTALLDLAQKNPKSCEVHWRLAKAAFLLASEEMLTQSDNPNERQKELMQRAHEAVAIAVQLNDECGDAHKWMAIITGSVTQFLPVQEQIKSAYDIKEHIQAAIRYKPTDALAYHMLGRWCYSVYMLSWVERKVAATLFAVPPTATIDEAMKCFLKAEELNPRSSVDNALYLGKSYIAQRDYDNAVQWLRIGSKMPTSTRDDLKSLTEIRDLLSQYESYVDS